MLNMPILKGNMLTSCLNMDCKKISNGKSSYINLKMELTSRTNIPLDFMNGIIKALSTSTPFVIKVNTAESDVLLVSNVYCTMVIYKFNDEVNKRTYISSDTVFDLAYDLINSISDNIKDWSYWYGTCINSYKKTNEMFLRNKLKTLRSLCLD